MKKLNKFKNYINCKVKGNKKKYYFFSNSIFIAILMLSCYGNASAQNNFKRVYKLGGTIESYVSGNGHGTFYSPSLSIGDGKNFFYGGPVIQKRSMLVQGVKIGYSRVLTGAGFHGTDDQDDLDDSDRLLQLNFFCYAQYVNQLPLSYMSIKEEELMSKKCNINANLDNNTVNSVNWSNVKLTTAETCVGFELHIKINQNISWKNYIGASVYYHLNYEPSMYQERIANVLMLGTGICIKHF